MFKKTILSALVATGLMAGGAAHAAGAAGHIEDYSFSFEGPFGTYDEAALQRGFQVYHEVCAACHGIRQVYFRNLGDEGGPHFPAEQVKAIAALYEVADTSDDAEPGDTRPGTPADKFPANTGAGAPDLSMMAKARSGFHGPLGTGINQFLFGIGGPEYIASLLTGYTGKEYEEAVGVLYENTAFAGGKISMAAPLEDDIIEYQDGTPATVEQMAKDVTHFLMWTAEPKMMARKRAGLTAVILLSVLFVLLYFTNKKLWAPIKRKD